MAVQGKDPSASRFGYTSTVASSSGLDPGTPLSSPPRTLVKDGKPTCPEGAALIRKHQLEQSSK